MAERLSYGGNGSVERSEYAELTRMASLEAYQKASELIEDIISSAGQTDDIINNLQSNAHFLERETTFTSYDIYTDADDTTRRDQQKEGLPLVEMPFGVIKKDVIIRHHIHHRSPIKETYFVAIERTVPKALQQLFFTLYEFDSFVDGSTRLMVSGTDVTPTDFSQRSSSRKCSHYDMAEFTKEMDEIVRHIQGADAEGENIQRFE